jgi:polymerase delta-interacting protein 2
VFGYRGVLLFPWLARVYDRDLLPNQNKSHVAAVAEETTDENHPTTNTDTTSVTASNSSAASKDAQLRTHTFYQVLIDQRDCPFIRAQTEAVTFLGNQDSSRSLYAIPGLDYVAHEDILPYSSGEKSPLQHELFDKFLGN